MSIFTKDKQDAEREASDKAPTFTEDPTSTHEADANDIRQQMKGILDGVDKHLAVNEKQLAASGRQLADNDKRIEKLDSLANEFGEFTKDAQRRYNEFIANMGKRFDTGVDRNLKQLSEDIDKSFADKINTGIASGIKELKDLNDVNLQKLIDHAVKKNVFSFYLTAFYGLTSSLIGCVGYDLIQHNHNYTVWLSASGAVIAFIALTYYADHRANR